MNGNEAKSHSRAAYCKGSKDSILGSEALCFVCCPFRKFVSSLFIQNQLYRTLIVSGESQCSFTPLKDQQTEMHMNIQPKQTQER